MPLILSPPPLPLIIASLWITLCVEKDLVSFVHCFMLTWTLDIVQITGETVGEVKAVADMHQRKAEMARHSDAFIALPGWYNP
jgi:hypothetical protein